MNPRIVVFVALIALGAGLAAWLTSTRPAAPRAPAAGTAPAPPGAVQTAEVESLAIKNRWVEELSGIDVSALAPAQHDIFIRFANAERCTCGCGYTLAGCNASDMSCEVSGPRLRALLDSVRTGRRRSADGVRQRPNIDPVQDD